MHSPRNNSRAAAFTLLEMMCAIAVLSVLCVLLLSILGGASSAIQSGGRRQEATSEARSVFGCLGADLAGQIRRPDISFGYAPADATADTTGNDELTFYTAATALDGDRGTSLVTYRLDGFGNLERGTAGLSWSGSAPKFLAEGEIGQIRNYLAKIPSANFQVLSSRILRFEVSFLVRDSTKVTIEPQPPVNSSDLLALVVAIAVLDEESQAKIDESAFPKIASLLPDPASGEEAVDVWLRELNDSSFAQRAGLPQAAVSQIRIQQRYFPLQ